jgi:hypothetical protein
VRRSKRKQAKKEKQNVRVMSIDSSGGGRFFSSSSLPLLFLFSFCTRLANRQTPLFLLSGRASPLQPAPHDYFRCAPATRRYVHAHALSTPSPPPASTHSSPLTSIPLTLRALSSPLLPFSAHFRSLCLTRPSLRCACRGRFDRPAQSRRYVLLPVFASGLLVRSANSPIISSPPTDPKVTSVCNVRLVLVDPTFSFSSSSLLPFSNRFVSIDLRFLNEFILFISVLVSFWRQITVISLHHEYFSFLVISRFLIKFPYFVDLIRTVISSQL